MPQLRLEKSMDEWQQRLMVMHHRLHNTRQLISSASLVDIVSRRQLVKRFSQVTAAVAEDVVRLPKNLIIEDKNLADELRRVQRGCVSIIQALNDRECSRAAAITLGQKINRRLRRVNQLLRSVTIAETVPAPIREAILRQRLINPETTEPVLPTIAAQSPKPRAVLHDFSELDQYQAMEDLRNKIRIAEQANKSKAEKPPAAEPPPATIQPYDAGQHGQYGERLNEDAARQQKLYQSVQHLLPKQVSFKSGHEYAILHAPLLVVTDHFVANNVFAAAKIKFDRLYATTSLTPGYIPGYGKNKDVHISPVILYQQLLMAVPLKVAMDKVKFTNLLENSIDALSMHLGQLVPMAIGAQSTEELPGRKTTNRYTEQMLEQQEQIRIIKTQRRENQRRELLNRNPKNKKQTLLPDIPTDELLHSGKSLRRLRQEKPKPFRVYDDKRRYFVHKNYPHVAFVWLLRHAAFTELSRVKFWSVNFAIYDRPSETTVSPAKPDVERGENLRQAREALHGDLTRKYDALNKLYRDNIQRVKDLRMELAAEREVEITQQKVLTDIKDSTTPQWRAAHEAHTITRLNINKLDGELAGIADIMPEISRQRKALQEEVNQRIKQAAEQRRKMRDKK